MERKPIPGRATFTDATTTALRASVILTIHYASEELKINSHDHSDTSDGVPLANQRPATRNNKAAQEWQPAISYLVNGKTRIRKE